LARRTGGKGDDVAALELLLPIGDPHEDRPVEYEQPLLLVLVVIRAQALAGRQIEDLDRQRRGAERLGHMDGRGPVAVRVLGVVLVVVVEGVDATHVASLDLVDGCLGGHEHVRIGSLESQRQLIAAGW
jgi:hypothetical protein